MTREEIIKRLRPFAIKGSPKRCQCGAVIWAPIPAAYDVKSGTQTGAFRAWHLYLMKHGWNIDDTDHFICPDCIARVHPPLKLSGYGEDPDWVKEDLESYEKWVKELQIESQTIGK